MKYKKPLFTMLQQCVNTILASETHWITRVIGLAALPLLVLMIPLMTVLVCPERLTIVAACVVAVMTPLPPFLFLAVFIAGAIFAVFCVRSAG